MIQLKRESVLQLSVAELLDILVNWLDWPLSPEFETDGKPYVLLNCTGIAKQYVFDHLKIIE